ncbi:MAG: hypothetical protein R3F43_28395 [bacterium]
MQVEFNPAQVKAYRIPDTRTGC